MRTIHYTYDGLRRLTGAAEAPGTTYGYSYDLAGNRTAISVNGATVTTYAYDPADQVRGWTYDAAGNLTGDGATSYSYDALDELTGTSAISATRSYTYNGDGTLVSQVAGGATTRYAQDLAAGQAQVLAAISGTSTTDFLYGNNVERLAAVGAGLRTWYGADAQGSMRQTLDDSANVLATQNYDPYGQPETAARPSQYFGYTGELQDGVTGYENLRARWYQPGTGMLLGVDPALEQTGMPYAYANDNPVNGSDPSGACRVDLPLGGSLNVPPLDDHRNCSDLVGDEADSLLGQVGADLGDLLNGVTTAAYAPNVDGRPGDLPTLRAQAPRSSSAGRSPTWAWPTSSPWATRWTPYATRARAVRTRSSRRRRSSPGSRCSRRCGSAGGARLAALGQARPRGGARGGCLHKRLR